jgi:phosphate starvation-inducible PhoH-like protein
MSRGRNRKSKQLSEEEVFEMEQFLNRNNVEEEKIFKTINIDVKPKTENQKALVNSIKNNIVTICNGFPGSGKTFLSCSEALRLLITDENIKRIVLVKSITPLKGEDIGFLPGDLKVKMAPIMESFTDNIRKIIGRTRMEKLLELGVIEIAPIAFVRGRTIDNAVIIIDEAQNISRDNIKTLMTRIGDNSKLIIMGDVKQKDIKNKRDSALEIVFNKFKGKDNFGCVELKSQKDILRHPIIKVIEDAFDELDEEDEKKINNKI